MKKNIAATPIAATSEGGDFRFEDRGSRLILTAPHAVRTLRDNRPKAPDLCTGALTRLAGEQNDVSTIIRRRTGEERNAAAGFVIDRQLANHCFLDIHGMNGGREFELAVGTGILPAADYAPELELIGRLAEKYKIRWVTNHPDYTGRFGLTGSLQRLNPLPRILQLEWRSDLARLLPFSRPTCSSARCLFFPNWREPRRCFSGKSGLDSRGIAYYPDQVSLNY